MKNLRLGYLNNYPNHANSKWQNLQIYNVYIFLYKLAFLQIVKAGISTHYILKPSQYKTRNKPTDIQACHWCKFFGDSFCCPKTTECPPKKWIHTLTSDSSIDISLFRLNPLKLILIQSVYFGGGGGHPVFIKHLLHTTHCSTAQVRGCLLVRQTVPDSWKDLCQYFWRSEWVTQWMWMAIFGICFQLLHLKSGRCAVGRTGL